MAHPRSSLKLIVLSGPAGVGKSIIVKRLVEKHSDIRLSVSATTRPKRPGEVEGADRYFVSDAEFDRMVVNGDFLEHATYAGYRYGTLRSEVERIIGTNKLPLLEIEVQGAREVMLQVPEALTIFVLPPDRSELERRLRGRGTEEEEVVIRRLIRSRAEVGEADLYDYRIVNRQVEEAVQDIILITRAESGANLVGEAAARIAHFGRSARELVPSLFESPC